MAQVWDVLSLALSWPRALTACDQTHRTPVNALGLHVGALEGTGHWGMPTAAGRCLHQTWAPLLMPTSAPAPKKMDDTHHLSTPFLSFFPGTLP